MSAPVTAGHAQQLLLDSPLPVLPPGSVYLLEARSDENMGFADAAKVVEKFPSIALRILAVANSVWSSPVSHVDDLVQACARLGFKVVRSITIAVAIASPFDCRRCPGFKADTYWTSAMLTSMAADLLATRMQDSSPYPPGVAATAGVLSNLGLLLLASRLPSQADAAFNQAHEQQVGVLQATREHCGVGYDEAGALLLEAWDLPEILSEALAQQYALNGDVAGHWGCSPLGLAVFCESALRRGLEDLPTDPATHCQLLDRQGLNGVYQGLLREQDRVREMAMSMGL